MLKLENVSYRYKSSNRDAIKNICADFEAGKVYAIVGPSGSGKTTLLSILAGLDVPASGEVSIDGDNLSALDLDRYRRERVSMIFQAFNLFPLSTAVENVCFSQEVQGVDKNTAKENAVKYLESLGIDADKQKRFPANLSGGEQQRVAIARAMATGAKVILADEPTGNLDEENGKAIISVLKNLAHENGYCVIIVTHNPEIADASDFVYRMSDGVLKD